MAHILFTVDYDPNTKKANVTPEVLQLDSGDQVQFATKTPDLAIKFAQGLPPGKLPANLKADELYKIPHVTQHLAIQGPAPEMVHFECGTQANGTFTPYKGGGDVPGGGPGGD